MNFVSGIAGLASNIIGFLKGLYFSVQYAILKGIFFLIEFIELLFKKIAGIENMSFGSTQIGGDNGTDLVFAFIQDERIKTTFWSILGFSIIMLVIFTIVAIIKTEFHVSDTTKYAKTPIIARSLKAIAQFFVVPIVFIVGILASNFLTQSVYRLFNPDEQVSITAKCFTLGGYSANRARLDPAFAKFLRTGDFLEDSSKDKNPFANLRTDEEIANLIDSLILGTSSESGVSAIDSSGNYLLLTLNYKNLSNGDWNEYENDVNGGYAPWESNALGFPNEVSEKNSVPYASFKAVLFYYDPFEYNFLFALLASIILAYNFLAVCLALFKRAFEMVILFLISPVVVSLSPLDGGSAVTKWQGEMIKRLFAVIAPLFAYNMFLLLTPILFEINVFGSTASSTASINLLNSNFSQMGVVGLVVGNIVITYVVANLMFQLIVLIVGSSFIKTGSKWLGNFLGINDLVTEGTGMVENAAKQAVNAAVTTATIATGVGVMGAGGLSKLAGGIKGFASNVRAKHTAEGKALLSSKKESVMAEKKLSEVEKKYGSDSQEYMDAQQEYISSVGKYSNLKDSFKEGKYLEPNKKIKKIEEKKKILESQLKDASTPAERKKIEREINVQNKLLEKEDEKRKNRVQRVLDFDESHPQLSGKWQQVKDLGGHIKEGTTNSLWKAGHHPFHTIGGAIGKSLGAVGGSIKKYYDEHDNKKTFSNMLNSIGNITGVGSPLKEAKKLWGESSHSSKIKKQGASAKGGEEDFDQVVGGGESSGGTSSNKVDEIIEELELMKAIMAADMITKGSNEEKEYAGLKEALQQAQRMGDVKEIKIAKANIENFETKHGITQKAQEAYRNIDNDVELQRKLMEKKAELIREAKEQAAREAGIPEDFDKDQKTKIDDDQLNNLVKNLSGSIGEQLKSNSKELEDMFKGIQQGIYSFSDGLDKIAKILEKEKK